jgi:putative tryptophan/tyrosine transport system substrate-binding protein
MKVNFSKRVSESGSDDRKSKIQNRKWGLSVIVFVLVVAGAGAEAQQSKRVPRIGLLSGTGAPQTPGPQVEAFQQGLRDRGYVEGKNLLIEYRYAEGKNERFPSLVAELVQLKVDVLVLTALPAILAAKQASKTIPIVMGVNADPVAAGIVESLAHPGGNITGLTRLTRELSGKRLELLKEAIPRVTRVGILWKPDSIALDLAFKEYESAARALKMQLQSLEVRGPNPDFEGAFQAAVKGRVHAFIAITDILLSRNSKRIADFAIKQRLPSMHELVRYVDAGGLMSYGSTDAENYQRLAYYVDRILKGAKPADLPVEQPTKFEFVVNLKTAKQIGLAIPPNVLARADRVIR